MVHVNIGEAVALLGILALLVFMRKGLTWAGTAKEKEQTRLAVQRMVAERELMEVKGKVALTEYAREMRLMPGDVVRELMYKADRVEAQEDIGEEESDAEEPAWKCDYCDTLNSSRVDRCSHCNAARGS